MVINGDLWHFHFKIFGKKGRVLGSICSYLLLIGSAKKGQQGSRRAELILKGKNLIKGLIGIFSMEIYVGHSGLLDKRNGMHG